MLAALTVALLAYASAQSTDPALPPIPWPSQHTHLEIQYTIDNGAVTEKPVWYDYTNLHYRADGYLLTPNAPLAIANLSSYWLENDLFIYQSLIGPGPLAICVHLNLGFGMMTPTWFMDNNASIFGTVYATHRSDSADNVYTPVTLSRKDGAGQGFFDYYSTNTTGESFSMHAPSPAGFVVNEYLVRPIPTPFAADAPEFALPAGIPCVNTTLAAALRAPGGFHAHVAQALRAPAGYRLALPELYLSEGWRAAVAAAEAERA